MADLVKKIKIKKQDGTFTDYIPIGAEAQNIETSDGDSVQLKLNKKPYYYNSVADMKADLKLKAGDMAVTLGYYEPNDSGRAEYKIVNSSDSYYETLNNNLKAELIIKDYVMPEQFGAHGDGITNDTSYLLTMLTIKAKYVCNKTYLYNQQLIVKNSMSGHGEFIKNSTSDTPIYFKGSNITVENLTFNGNETLGRLVETLDINNIKFSNCTFKNVGTLNDDYSNALLFVKDNSYNVEVINCSFIKCYAQQVATLFWNQGGKYIDINNCYFEDVQPADDGDGVKTLGGEAYLTVQNCYFKNCAKRAMKFQSKYCYSINNYVYALNKMFCPIDFQRGYGSSLNDTIELEWDGTTAMGSSGFGYNYINICKGYVTIENLIVKITLPENTEFPVTGITTSRGILFSSLTETDRDIKHVVLRNIMIDGSNQAIFISNASGGIESIDDLLIENFTFTNRFTNTYCCIFGYKNITNLNVVNFNVLGKNANCIIWESSNVTNSYFKINSASPKLQADVKTNSGNRYELSGGSNYSASTIRNQKTVCFSNTSNNPSESTYSTWNELKNQPAGTICLIDQPVVDSTDNTKMRIGYISTTAGTGTTCGTFLPIYVQITTPTNQ